MSCKTTSNTNPTTGHLRGSVLLVAGRVLAIFINFAVQMLTVRYLAKADYGVFAFALSVAGVLSVLSSFGMDKAASRFLAVYLQNREYRSFWGMLVLMFGTVVTLGALAVVIFVSAWALGLPVLTSNRGTQLVLAMIAGLAVCNALEALFISLFAVLVRPAAVFVRQHLVGPLFNLTAAVVVVMSGGNVVAFAAGQLIAAVFGVAICLFMFFGIVSRQPDLREALSDRFVFPIRQLFRYSATLLSGDLAFLLRSALVPLVLGLLFAGAEVATYQAVAPLARLNEFVLVTFSILFLPNAAKLAAAKRDVELQTLFEQTTLWVTLLSFPLFAVSFLASQSLPVLLFGQQYQTSGSILAWLALGYFANASFGTNLRLLRAFCQLRTLLAADLMLILIASALVFGLVPRYGALGGAWAVCGTYIAQSILYQTLVATTTNLKPFKWRCVAPFFAGVGLCVAGHYVLDVLFRAGLLGSVLVATLISTVVLVAFGRELDVLGTFPELSKLSIFRRWLPSASGKGGLA